MSAKSSKGLGHSVGISADFDITLRTVDVEGNILSERTPIRNCPNLITNRGMDLLATTSVDVWMAYCHVGTSATEPTFTDLLLTAKRNHTNTYSVGDNSWSQKGDGLYSLSYTRVYAFALGSVSGDLKEIGISENTTNINTHALLKDAFGDPTTISVASNELLIVTYRLHFTPNQADSTLVTTQKGTEYTLTLRPKLLGVNTPPFSGFLMAKLDNSYNGAPIEYFYGPTSGIGPVTGNCVGTKSSTFGATFVKEPYVSGTYYTRTNVTYTVSQANSNDIGVIYSSSSQSTSGIYAVDGASPFKIQIGISPRISKTALDTIKLTIKVSWYRT